MEYKGYNIVHRGTHALFDIKRTGSGPVPKELRGGFTTTSLAKVHIDSYESNKGRKSNAKPKATSTD